MEATTPATIAGNLSGSMTRRSALRGLFAGAVAAVAAAAVLEIEETSAKRRKKKGGKRSPSEQPQTGQPLLAPGSRCESSSQCVSSYIDDVCDPTTRDCSNPTKLDTTPCDIGDACFTGDIDHGS